MITINDKQYKTKFIDEAQYLTIRFDGEPDINWTNFRISGPFNIYNKLVNRITMSNDLIVDLGID